MTQTHSLELQTAIKAAKKGAAHALSYFDKPLTVSYKNDNSPVTIADKESEEVIKKYISSQFPQALFLGEEEGGSINEESLWIIDPIDGTKSFSRGIPGWCVLIALYKNSEFVLGVCHFPIFNQTLYAEKGKGAFLDGKKIHVSDVKNLHDAFLGHSSPKKSDVSKILFQLITATRAVRGWEVTYANFLLALGKVDLSFDPYAKIWDCAPFAVIIPEAGGKITRLTGEKISLTGEGCLLSNGILHNEAIKVIQILEKKSKKE